MAKVADVKNQLATRAKQKLTIEELNEKTKDMGPKEKIRHYLENMEGDIAKMLPSHINPERMTNLALTVIRTNPALLECSIASLLGAVIQAAQLGLEPGLMGHCHFVPFNNKKTGPAGEVQYVREVQFIIGYKGMIDLARRSGHIRNIYCYPVYEKDHFEYELGLEPKLEHKPFIGDRGKLILVYGVAHFNGGGHHIEVMSKQEIEAIRTRGKTGKAWTTDYDEMGKKTVIRRMFKYLPISVEVQEGVSRDETVKQDITSEPEIIEYEEVAPEPELIESEIIDSDEPPPQMTKDDLPF